jgi:hypothetical protein
MAIVIEEDKNKNTPAVNAIFISNLLTCSDDNGPNLIIKNNETQNLTMISNNDIYLTSIIIIPLKVIKYKINIEILTML